MSKEMGLFGLSIPEKYGGLGIGTVGKRALYEEIGAMHNGYTMLIGAYTGMGLWALLNLEMKNKRRSTFRIWPVVSRLVLLPSQSQAPQKRE